MYRAAQSCLRNCLRSSSEWSVTRHLNSLTDMDGTLTVPTLDFKEMRRRVGILEGDILEVISNMDEPERLEASRVLHEFEVEALKDMKVMPGAADLAQFLDMNSVPRGLITRNVKESVAHFHESVFPVRKPFQPALARCFTPPKPSPASLLHICSEWGIGPHEAVMIGDSPADDIVCGNTAGAVTILIDFERRYDTAALPATQQPTHHVFSMQEVRDVLQHQCTLHPAERGVAEAV